MLFFMSFARFNSRRALAVLTISLHAHQFSIDALQKPVRWLVLCCTGILAEIWVFQLPPWGPFPANLRHFPVVWGRPYLLLLPYRRSLGDTNDKVTHVHVPSNPDPDGSHHQNHGKAPYVAAALPLKGLLSLRALQSSPPLDAPLLWAVTPSLLSKMRAL